MSSTRFPVSPAGYKKLEEELQILKSVERPNVIRAIAEARAHGDLSENAEYHAAKEKQGFIEAKIQHLEFKLSAAQIIDVSNLDSNQIQFGAKVTLVDEETKEAANYEIVSEFEADTAKGMISIASPIAKAMLGKKVGEVIEVFTPKGEKYFEVTKISY
jgi:transcription elongation factor GreA